MYPTSVGTSQQKEHLTGFLLHFAQIVRAQNLESVANLYTNQPQTIRSKTPQKSVNFFGCKQRVKKIWPQRNSCANCQEAIKPGKTIFEVQWFEKKCQCLVWRTHQIKCGEKSWYFLFWHSPIDFWKQNTVPLISRLPLSQHPTTQRKATWAAITTLATFHYTGWFLCDPHNGLL